MRLQRGDEWAFQLMVRRFRKRIFLIAFGITLDTEESRDIMQGVFLQVRRTVGGFRADASLPTWLHRITVKRSLNWKRRWARRFKRLHVSTDSGDGQRAARPESNLPSPEIRMANAQRHQQIDQDLQGLPVKARALYVLRELEGLSYEAIADAIGIKLETVRTRLFDARRRLNEILQPLAREENAHPDASGCDQILLNRYLDGELAADETAQVEAHIAACQQCRGQVTALATFSQGFRDRVQDAVNALDFVALEKQVLNKALRQYRSRGGFSRLAVALKYFLPATATVGLLLFFNYSNSLVEPPSEPSAIINSIAGSMSSVMIFETPETRQTILWYSEDTDLESEPNGV